MMITEYDTISVRPVNLDELRHTEEMITKKIPGACSNHHTGTTFADWDEWDWAVHAGSGGAFWIIPPHLRHGCGRAGKPVDDDELKKTLVYLDSYSPDIYITGSPDFTRRIQALSRKIGIRAPIHIV